MFPFRRSRSYAVCDRQLGDIYTPSSARVSPAGVPLALPTFQRAIFALLPRCPHSVWGNENFVDGILLENQTFLNAAKFAEHVSLTFLKDISSLSKPEAQNHLLRQILQRSSALVLRGERSLASPSRLPTSLSMNLPQPLA